MYSWATVGVGMVGDFQKALSSLIPNYITYTFNIKGDVVRYGKATRALF
jgi:hypothetical protein